MLCTRNREYSEFPVTWIRSENCRVSPFSSCRWAFTKTAGSTESDQGFQLGSSSSEGEVETGKLSKRFTKPANATGSSLETI